MASYDPNALDWACFALLILGALNWGFVGVAEINLVEAVLEPIFTASAGEAIARIIYALVGLAGIYFFYPLYRVFNRGRRNRAG